MTITRTRSAAALAVVAVLGAGGTALAQTAGGDPTTVTVTPEVALKAGDIAPFDAAGVKAIRRGKAIPAGYVLPGYRVQTEKGTKTAGAALRLVCPGGKRLRTLGTTGNAGLQITRDYVDHVSTMVLTFPSGTLTSSDGRVFAVCR